jgi:Icc-related predicted phosphoesterase
MRALIISDLHQNEGGADYDPSAISAVFDVAIVAGDAAGRLTYSLLWLNERFGGVPVIYVAGNHDFYRSGTPGDGFTFEDELLAGRDLAARLGIHLLENDRLDLDGIRFLGATLWTDLRSKVHFSQFAADGAAKRGMNDYRRIHRRSTTRGSRPIGPEFTRNLHRTSTGWLSAEMAIPFNGPTIVVTHHAPSPRSLPDLTDPLGHTYASDMHTIVESGRPALWVHGHIHRYADYKVGATRILCNAQGRAGEASQFQRELVIDMNDGTD